MPSIGGVFKCKAFLEVAPCSAYGPDHRYGDRLHESRTSVWLGSYGPKAK
jgi:hypothetical protein